MSKKRTPANVATSSPTEVQRLGLALEAEDDAAAATALRQISSNHANWRRILSHLDALPDPAGPRTDPPVLARRCRTLQRAAMNAELEPADRLWIGSLALVTARSAGSFAHLRAFLRSLAFFSDSLSTQTYRLAVFIEHQSRQGMRLAQQHGELAGGYHPYAILDHYLPAPMGGKASILGAYEELVEAAELILRYSHYSCSADQRSAALVPRHPFFDPDLERLFKAAGVWRALLDVGCAVRFARWHTHAFPGDHACYSPTDHDEYVRHRVGDLREQAIMAQFWGESVDIDAGRSRHDALRAIAKELSYPEPGRVWDGRYPKKLAELVRSDRTLITRTEQWLSFRHYEPFARAIRLDGSECGWDVWLAARNAMEILAETFSLCVADPGGEDPADDWRRYILVVRKSDLVQFARETGLTKRQAEVAMSSMIFDQKRRSLELWDTPLLPLSPEKLVFIPSLWGASSSARALENAVSQWVPTAMTARGFPFERDFLADLEEIEGGAAKRGIEISDQDGKPVEYDLVWWWGEHLFLVETKCLHSVHSFPDFDSAKASIEYGIEQLRRRRNVLRSEWSHFRNAAVPIPLPVELPEDGNIIGILVTNLTCFTTLRTTDNLVVCDDVCFRRYFGDPSIAVYTRESTSEGRLVAQLGSIRSQPPSPTNFVEYLKAPPQWRSVRDRLTPEMVQSIASETEYPFWRLMLEYHPDLKQWAPRDKDAG